jgi:hypothetical protein
MTGNPGTCCNSGHIDEETRSLLAKGDALAEAVRDLFDLLGLWDGSETILRSYDYPGVIELTDWEYVRMLWQSRHCKGCESFRRPAAGPAPIDLAAELQECRERLSDLCPLPSPSRPRTDTASLTLAPANHHAKPILHVPHPEEGRRVPLAGEGGVMLMPWRPLPLPAPLRITLEAYEDSEECRA